MYGRIERENISRWYSLSFLPQGPSIALKIHKAVIPELTNILKKLEYTKALQEEFGLQDLCFDFENKNIGFGAVLVNHGKGITEKDSDFINLVGLIPSTRKDVGSFWTIDYQNTNAVAASFSILLDALNMVITKTESDFLQLLTVNTFSGKRYGISGKISHYLRLMHNMRPNTFPTVVDAMQKVWEKSFGKLIDFEKSYFRAYTQKGMLILDCSGDACGIVPNHWDDEEGYSFSEHNVDHPVQLLTLLAGLAATYDDADKM